MTRPIDERIVRMRLENQDFKTKADETIGIFSKIKDGLNKIPGVNLGKTVGELGNLKSAADKVTLGTLSSSLDTVTEKFSALDVVAFTVIQNLTNRVVDAGIKLGKALTIDGAKAGFQEYNQRIGAIQTMLAGAKNNQGMRVSLEEVNTQLEKLNEYSDKTIYSFGDMTKNISKFTNAGISLEDSTMAIKGVANVAALSGANAEEASRSMYNFAQAISTGSVKLIDWKSIENANMGTQEFKQQLLDSAVAAGTLKKEANGMYRVLTENNAGKQMKELINTTDGWQESLQYQWMTTEALTNTLKDYADETTDIGKRAAKSAQEVKTFTMMMDTTKEAIQSGWAKTSELIIGDFPTAVKRWTAVSEQIGRVVSRSATDRNNTMESLKNAGVFDNMWKGLINILTSVANLSEIVNNAFKKIFPTNIDGLKKLSEAFANITKPMELTGSKAIGIGKIFETIFKVFKLGIGIITGIISIIWELGKAFLKLIPDNLFKTIKAIVVNITQLGESVGTNISPLQKIKDLVGKLGEVFDKLAKAMEPVISFIGSKVVAAIRLFKTWIEKLDLSVLIDDFKTLWAALPKFTMPDLTPMTEGIGKLFSGIKLPDLSFIYNGLKGIVEIITGVKFKPFANPFANIPVDIQNLYLVPINKVKEIFVKLKDSFTKLKDIGNPLDKLKDIRNPFSKFPSPEVMKTSFINPLEKLSEVGEKVKKTWENLVTKLKAPFKFLGDMIKKGKEAFSKIGAFELFAAGSLVGGFSVIKRVLGIMKGVEGFLKAPGKLAKSFDKFVGNFSKVLGEVGGAIKTFREQARVDMLKKIAITLAILAGSLWVLSKLSWQQIVVGMSALGSALVGMLGALTVLDKLKFKNLNSGSLMKSMIGMGMGLLLISKAVANLSGIDSKSLTNGVTAVMVLLTGMVASISILSMVTDKLKSSDGKINKIVIAMGLLSVVIMLLTKSIVKLAKLPIDQMVAATAAVAVLLGVMMGAFFLLSKMDKSAMDNVLSFTKFANGLAKAGVAIALFALAAKLLGEAIAYIGALDIETIVKGVGALSLILVMFGLMEKIAGGAGGAGAGAGIMLVAIALNLLVVPLGILGKMPLDILQKGLISLVTMISILGLAMAAAKGAFGGGVAIALVVGSLMVLIPAITALGLIPLDTIAKGVLSMGAALAVLVIATNLLGGPKSIMGAVALGILAGSLNLLIGPMLALGQLNIDQIKAVLYGLSGALAILILSGLMLGSMVGIMVKASVAIAALSVSLLVLTVPLGILAVIPIKGAVIALGLLAITLGALAIASAALAPLLPAILGLAGAFMLFGAGMALTGVGVSILATGLLALAASVGGIAAGLITFIGLVIDGLSKLIPTIVKKGAEILMAFLIGLKDAIREKGPLLLKAAKGLVLEIAILIIKGLIDCLKALTGWFPGVNTALDRFTESAEKTLRENFDPEALGNEVGESYANGVSASGPRIADESGNMANIVATNLGSVDGEAAGTGIMDSFTNGLGSKLGDVSNISMDASTLLSGGLTGFDSFGSGSDLMSNFTGGLNSSMPDLEGITSNIGGLTIDGFTNFDSLKEGKKKAKLFGDGIDSEKQYVKMKAANISDAAIKEMGLKIPDLEGKNTTKAYADGITSEQQYLIASARGISDKVLETLGLFPATPEGKKKALEFGRGLSSEQKYLRGVAEGLSKDTLAAMGLYPPTEEGKKKTKKLAEGLTSEAKYAVGAAGKVSEQVLNAMGLYPPTEEGKKKAKKLGKGIESEKQYAIGKAMGLSEEILNAMDLYPPIDVGKTKSKDLARGIIANEGEVSTAARQVSKTAKDNLERNTVQIGRDYVEGTIEGMDDKKTAIGRAAARIANTAINRMRSTFDIHSPSRVSRTFGRLYGDGLIVGMDNRAEGVAKSAERMTNKAKRAVRNFVDTFAGDFIDNGEPREVTFQPVIDYSKLAPVPDQAINLKSNLDKVRSNMGQLDFSSRQNGLTRDSNKKIELHEIRDLNIKIEGADGLADDIKFVDKLKNIILNDVSTGNRTIPNRTNIIPIY